MSNTRKRRPAKESPKGLRQALAEKKVRRTHYDIPVVESDVADAAGFRVSEARNLVRASRLTLARVKGTEDEADVAAAVEESEKHLAEAEADYAACFYRVHFRGLPEVDFNALQNAVPEPEEPEALPADASDEQREAHAAAQVAYEAASDAAEDDFIFALMEACADDSDMTADEWREELSSPRWSKPDRAAIRRAAVEANVREFSATVPKD